MHMLLLFLVSIGPCVARYGPVGAHICKWKLLLYTEVVAAYINSIVGVCVVMQMNVPLDIHEFPSKNVRPL
ncbi:hypothetical protein FA15DRAFT_674783 [Coprinopsis marcescibilis]|uniref:Secreted protein n=1 Tax=Coprinopsis marcescibilis TaxID=230819 RepID=A0A5C3KGU4_COPMA|nr:hypothetical protein FA15DRAFT_674783 [Coprinopsis marcescibilis]